MGTIRARTNAAGKKRYRAEVRIKGAPRISQTFPTKRVAEQWMTRVENEIKSGRFVPRLASETHTVNEAIEKYRAEILPNVKLATKTVKQREQQLKAWSKLLGEISIAQLTPAAIYSARNRLLRTMKPQSTNRYLATLGRLTKAMVVWGWATSNPLSDFERFEEAPGLVRFLTIEEAHDLCEAAKGIRDKRRKRDSPRSIIDGRIYVLVLAGIGTGARQGELMALKWKDLDLEQGKARLGRTKNGTARTLHLHGKLLGVLRQRSKTPHWSGYVFASPRTTPDKPPGFPRKHWEQAVEASGVEDLRRFHTLRHTFASWLAMSGATVVEIAHLLGHTTLAMVKRYSHIAEEHGVDVSRKVVSDLLK